MTINMMSNVQIPPKKHAYLMKLTLISFSFLTLLFFFFFLLRPTQLQLITQSTLLHHLQPTQTQTQTPFTNLPPHFSQTLIHYATSKTTPQQTLQEISVTDRVLRANSPCNFLVFGLGHDSLLWAALNSGGRTLFLEEDLSWIHKIRAEFPHLDSRHVQYATKLPQAEGLLRAARSSKECGDVVDPRESDCVLALKTLPVDVYEVEWDVIMVDAPTGYHAGAPGRMTAIYTAGLMARRRSTGGRVTQVMVHDVDRAVEDRFSREFLCDGYLKEAVGRLRRFVLPTHIHGDAARPFCPTITH